MCLNNDFVVRSATFAGRDHIKATTPCQDSITVYSDERLILAVLSDGAGSAVNSHIGSYLLTNWTISYLRSQSAEFLKKLEFIFESVDTLAIEPASEKVQTKDTDWLKQLNLKSNKFVRWLLEGEDKQKLPVLEPVEEKPKKVEVHPEVIDWYVNDKIFSLVNGLMEGLVEKIQLLAASLATTPQEAQRTIETSMMATIVGAVVTPWISFVFWLGDGIYAINDKKVVIEAGDKPKVVGYAAYNPEARTGIGDVIPQKFSFSNPIPTKSIESIIISSDGGKPFIKQPDLKIPKMDPRFPDEDTIGDYLQFAQQPRYVLYEHELAARIRLLMANNTFFEDAQGSRHVPFNDDLSLVVIRRAIKED